ncbi:Iron-sulfur cluster assembly accessory protein Isa1 [Penicillium macrosclerotiorum]|uniref:Iron-sulfur cluster assembly accessory protein Isa1 n=1 Tax=Penicillium macrosclerotiorum TaxID=303699 RepID=UPI0025495A9A|nr:Iron-sulfur cluster assembly accessory protein Isa1 [Penicillium macrosclerotiorum]KAJ5662761.1 Iron-sulfur cluster assembly accessory protein Isa1 [Penicillium macrosclerotiorum]
MSFGAAMQRPVTSSATLLRWTKPSITLRCSSLRCFSSNGNAYQSSKRDMQTATAYRPHTLPSSFPMPRSSGASDAFLSADFPLPSGSPKAPSPSQSEAASISMRESEAQKTKSPSTAPSTAPPKASPKASPKPRRPLRARKAAMKLTPLATEQLRNLMSQPDPKFIRVGVKNRGCSGLAYHLEYVEQPGKFDEIVEQDGVKVLIDSKALFSIIGSEMDWHEDKLSRRFVFRNPNIKEQCGCGESFMV